MTDRDYSINIDTTEAYKEYREALNSSDYESKDIEQYDKNVDEPLLDLCYGK